jgi:6,7-dimethyl-8-ribityllumazine synthase
MDLNLRLQVPVIFCVLTDDTLQQAKDRSGGRHGNKGAEAAIAALKMAAL